MIPACQNDGCVNKNQKPILTTSDTGSFMGPYIKFDTTVYNFGKVYEGERVGAYFKFKNLGNKNLVLTNVSTTCGCTIPAYSEEPLTPGMEGEIKVIFDTYERTGYQYNTVNVKTNTEQGEIELVITAEVVKN